MNEKICAQCKTRFLPKNRLSNKSGFFFCSKECIYLAQKKNGVTYELRRKRSLEKYGKDFPISCDEIKEKRKKNNIEKYGVANTFELDAVKEKTKKTTRERYGVDVYSQTIEFKSKIEETNLKRFGYKSPIENPDILAQRRQTMTDRYGGPSTLESPILREKMEATCRDLFGTSNIVMSPQFISSSMDKKLLKTHGKTWQQYIDDLPALQDYRRKVEHITRQQAVETLPYYDKWGEYHLDHKFSIAEGFRQGLSPEIIGNIANLEFIPAHENMSKQDDCSIDKHSLLLEIERMKGHNNE
jgi:hypothetical protein